MLSFFHLDCDSFFIYVCLGFRIGRKIWIVDRWGLPLDSLCYSFLDVVAFSITNVTVEWCAVNYYFLNISCKYKFRMQLQITVSHSQLCLGLHVVMVVWHGKRDCGCWCYCLCECHSKIPLWISRLWLQWRVLHLQVPLQKVRANALLMTLAMPFVMTIHHNRISKNHYQKVIHAITGVMLWDHSTQIDPCHERLFWLIIDHLK